jgi:2-isopropylmalate synthase
LDKNLKQVEESCRFLKRHKRLVVFDAEHFFDGFKDNSGYAIDVCRAAVAGGADWIVPCETNGGALPWEVGQFMDALAEILGPEVNLGIHAHNDGGLGTANSLEGVRHGATMVQGTMNGIGERCGNADLCSIIPNLQVKMGHLVLTDNQLKTLTETSRFISEVGNLAHNERLPFVGNSAFAHKGGIHVSAIQKDSRMYEHISPSLVGNHQRVLVSELSGKSNIDYKLKELNIRLPKGSANLSREVVAKIKKLENEGFQFEGAEGSLELLIKKAIGKYKNIFDLNHYRCTIEKRAEELVSEAAVKLTVKGKEEYVVAEGNGPVNALDKALRKALQKFYPSLKAVKLADYKVRVLGSDDGTDARVRVLIESYDKNRVWGTVGVSENIIDASWSALVDSLEYFLHKK